MFGSKSIVDLLVWSGKIDIAVALDSDIVVNSAFGFCYLLADSAQAASSPFMGVLEVGPTAVSQPDASGGGWRPTAGNSSRTLSKQSLVTSSSTP